MKIFATPSKAYNIYILTIYENSNNKMLLKDIVNISVIQISFVLIYQFALK